MEKIQNEKAEAFEKYSVMVVHPNDLGVEPTVDFGPEIGSEPGYKQEDLVRAFKENGLTPINDLKILRDLLDVLDEDTNIPLEDFFTNQGADVLCTNGSMIYSSNYSKLYGGWPQDMEWLLQKVKEASEDSV